MQGVSNPHMWATINNCVGASPQTGEVGIEIEVEGKNLPTEMQYSWSIHQDGSLKSLKPGDQTAEYVLRKPVARDKVGNVLRYFDKNWAEAGAIAHESLRTSVHVHLNFQKHTQVEAVNMAVLWYIFEEPLVAWCGEDRVNNLFCLRADDAEAVILQLISAIRNGSMVQHLGDNIRYAALNMAALSKYGSIEIRSLRGTVDTQVIEAWVKVLLKLKDAAVSYENPIKIIQDFSSYGPEEFAVKVLGEEFVEALGFKNNWASPWNGMRLAQDLAYATQWVKPVEKQLNGLGLAAYPVYIPGPGTLIDYIHQVKIWRLLNPTIQNLQPVLPGFSSTIESYGSFTYWLLRKKNPAPNWAIPTSSTSEIDFDDVD